MVSKSCTHSNIHPSAEKRSSTNYCGRCRDWFIQAPPDQPDDTDQRFPGKRGSYPLSDSFEFQFSNVVYGTDNSGLIKLKAIVDKEVAYRLQDSSCAEAK